MKVLTVRPFHACCGAEIIGHFGWAKFNVNSQGPRNLADLEDDLKALDKMTHVGLRCLTLAEEQIPYVEDLLRKYQYYPLVKGFGSNHESRLTLYAKVFKGAAEMGKLPYHGEAEKNDNKTTRTSKTVSGAWGAATKPGTRPVW